MKIQQLRFEGLSFSYSSEEPLFTSLDFDFPMNRTLWIKAGATGAGRSTLLQILAGLVTVQSGKYLINNVDVSQMSFEEFLQYRIQIGYTFDHGGLLHNRTILENLVLPLVYHKMASAQEAQREAIRLLEVMEIDRYKDQRPSSVPGGVRKTVCLLRPLLMHPVVMLLDDPSFGLGQEAILKYLDLLEIERQHHNLQHTFISSFDEKMMSLVECDEIYLLDGQLSQLDLHAMKRVVHL